MMIYQPTSIALVALIALVSQAVAMSPTAESSEFLRHKKAWPLIEAVNLPVLVNRCWNVGALSSEALTVTVTIGLSMTQDGKPDRASIHMVGYDGGTEAAANQAYEAGRRAIIICGDKGFPLPPEKYEQWKDIEMVFDPQGMRLK